MSLTSQFILTPRDFASEYAILVNEGGNAMEGIKVTKVAPVEVGKVLQYPAENMVFTFEIDRIASPAEAKLSYNQVSLVIKDLSPGTGNGAPRAYFLPWERNRATQMRLGGSADYFFTSTLSGCTVQVDGPRTTPRVVHANAGDLYEASYGTHKDVCPHGKPAEIHEYAETRANRIAQGTMNGMLPDPVGANGAVTKHDYVGKFEQQNLDTAKRNMRTDADYRVSKMKPAMGKGGLKPSVGAFVFGKKDVRDEWSFFYQSNIEVDGAVTRGRIRKENQGMFFEAVVLGRATQFYP